MHSTCGKRMADEVRCRSCGGDGLVDLGPIPGSQDERVSVQAHLYRCPHCALGQRHPIPDAVGIAALYADAKPEEMAYVYEDNAAWALARNMLVKRLVAVESPSVLDVGCHTGRFLAGLPKAWRRFGVENPGPPADAARRDNRVEIIADWIETVGGEWDARFDAVTLFDVIEHVPDPATAIGRLARLLKPGGVLIVSSGDLDAWTWRWLGAGHWYLQTPQHLSVISRGFLRHVAVERGLRLREFQTIPHRHAPRTQDAARLAYWGMRQRGGLWRSPQRLLHALPGLHGLRHMQSVPWAMSLRDHCVAVFEV
ncbi:MAG: Ubiquinone biosynthesis O-methyltransferase [Xanthomonadales bacterium]|nr:Ubiquinone biosynthesis O-methyltransferase [Xanthomonadales bacterium]